MKKLLMIPALVSVFLLTTTGFVFAETNAKEFTDVDGVIERSFVEDTVALEKEKIFEQEDFLALKGNPKSFTDGFNTYVNDKVQFKLANKDNIMQDKIFYTINKAEELVYTEPFSLNEEGSQVIYYYSIDKMGNKEEEKSLNVIVDKTAPEVTVTIKAPFYKNAEKIYASNLFKYEYTVASKDNIAGVGSVAYAIADADYTEYLNPFSINSKLEKIQVVAEDRVGNLTTDYMTKIVDSEGNIIAESYDVEILLDNTAPVVKISSDKEFFMKDSIKVASKDYKYSISALEEESGLKAIYYRINSKSDFILYSDPIQFNTNGWHKIEAIATDNVGNTSKAEVLDVYVDLIPAQTTIDLITK